MFGRLLLLFLYGRRELVLTAATAGSFRARLTCRTLRLSAIDFGSTPALRFFREVCELRMGYTYYTYFVGCTYIIGVLNVAGLGAIREH